MLYKLILIVFSFHISPLAAQQQGTESTHSTSQPKARMRSQYNFAKPLDIEMFLSGNYGEIRSNHFHSGIDIKTQGVIGKPVYAMESGYVSRIMVSPYGFGKAIYVTHPNGTISVYGHVEKFNNKIDAYVYEMQYQRKSFAVELYPTKDKFEVEKGDIIAHSGNRGSSGGPHLHIEVRDVAKQIPINMLSNNILSIDDTTPPRFVALYFVSVDTVQGVPIHTVREKRSVKKTATGSYLLSDTTAIKIGGTGYFAIEVSETKNGANNPLGIYSIDLCIDNKEIFNIVIDNISFDHARYAYAASLYPESKGKSNAIYRLHKLPNNPLGIYSDISNGVVNQPNDIRHHPIEINIGDDCQNITKLNFKILGTNHPYPTPTTKGTTVKWSENFSYNQDGLHLFIPTKSLYNSIFTDITKSNTLVKLNGYSPIYKIAPTYEVLQNYMTLNIDAESLPVDLRNKALIASLSSNGTFSSVGGKWQKSDKPSGEVTTRLRNFGEFFITVDTIAPRITPSFKSGDNIQSHKSLSFMISDNLSGIESYTATIDGKWALFEYDPKTRKATHFFDDIKWPKGSIHTINLEVKDAKGNTKSLTTKYLR